MIPQVSRLKRSLEHLAAAMVVALPINALITFSVSSLTSSPLMITLTTTILATIVSFIRTYAVLTTQDNREIKLAAEAA